MHRQVRAWWERLGLSLVVIGLVLAWEGYKRVTGRDAEPASSAQIAVYFAGAVVCAVLGFIGVGLRHRPGD